MALRLLLFDLKFDLLDEEEKESVWLDPDFFELADDSSSLDVVGLSAFGSGNGGRPFSSILQSSILQTKDTSNN